MISDAAAQVALVTGGGSGIGRAIALRLACTGASVLVVGRDAGKLDAVAHEAVGTPGVVTPVPLDLTRTDAGATLAQLVAEQHGRLDVLVHSAGLFTQGAILDVNVDTFGEQLATNAVAPYQLTRSLLPFLMASAGQVAFMNSSVVGARRSGISAYAASKAALAAVADTLREEVNAFGVRVLSMYIGRTATPMQERIFEEEGRAYDASALLQPDDIACMLMAALKLPRTAEVTDLHIRSMRKPTRQEDSCPRTSVNRR